VAVKDGRFTRPDLLKTSLACDFVEPMTESNPFPPRRFDDPLEDGERQLLQ